jgi:methionyl-tRNA formyltransferase
VTTARLKIIFAGTPDFAATALAALLQSQHEIVAVYTQPDRPAGRGRQLTASPVKLLALQNNIPLHQPLNLRAPEDQKILASYQADIMVVAAYGLLLPPVVLAAPRWGCLNIHASLLPRWRGAAPIQHAILAGDKKSGVTIMQMDATLDTGDILLEMPCEITIADTSVTLFERLAVLGASAILSALTELVTGKLHALPQDNSRATYAAKISKESALLIWNEDAEISARKVRAFNPWPVAHTNCDDKTLRIWQASVEDGTVSETPGTIVSVTKAGICVATARNLLRLEKLQLPGGKILAAADLINARHSAFTVGKVLG